MVLGRAVRLGGESQKSTPTQSQLQSQSHSSSMSDISSKPKPSLSRRQSNVFLVAPFEFNAPRWRDFTKDHYASRQQKLLTMNWTVKSTTSSHDTMTIDNHAAYDLHPFEPSLDMEQSQAHDSDNSHDSDWFYQEHPEHEISSGWPWQNETEPFNTLAPQQTLDSPFQFPHSLLTDSWQHNLQTTPNSKFKNTLEVSSSPLSYISTSLNHEISRPSSFALSLNARDSLFEEEQEQEQEPKPTIDRQSQHFLLSRLKPQRNLRREDALDNSENIPPSLPSQSSSSDLNSQMARRKIRVTKQEEDNELSFHSQFENSFSNSFEREFYLTPIKDFSPTLKKPCLLARPPLRAIKPPSPTETSASRPPLPQPQPSSILHRAATRPLMKSTTAVSTLPQSKPIIKAMPSSSNTVTSKPGPLKKKEVKIDDLKLLLEQYNNKVRPNRRKKPE